MRSFHSLIAISVLLTLLSLAPLFGGGQEEIDDDVTTIEFLSLFTGPDGETIESMVEEYNQTAGAEAGIHVDMLTAPHGDYYTQLTVQVASGEGPNIAINHSDRISGYVREGALLELEDSLLAEMGIRGEDFVPALWDAGEVDGVRYALPIDAFPQHLYYNPEMFAEAGLDPDAPPETLDELVEVAQALTNHDDDQWGLWFPMSGGWAGRTFLSVYWQFESDLLNDGNTAVSANFESAAEETLTVLGDLIHEYQVTNPDADDFEANAAQMADNKLGIIWAQITHIAALEELDFDFHTAALPTIGSQPASFALGHNFVLPQGPQQTEDRVQATYHFMDWFNANSIPWAEGGKVPSSQVVIDSSEFQELTRMHVVAQTMDHVVMPPLIPEGPEIMSAIVENVEAFYGGVTDVSETVRNMADEINAALD